MKYAPTATRSLTACVAMVLCAAAASAQETPVSASPAPGKTRACDQYGFTTVLFRCIPHDMRGIGNSDSWRWLAAGGVLAGGSMLLDDEVFKKLDDPVKDPPMRLGEYLGEAGVQFGVPAAWYFIARATGHQGGADMSIMLVRTQMVNAILTRGFKLVPRRRPYQDEVTLTKGSFPSGHTSAAFATATVLTRKWGWRAGVPAYAVASFVGATRLEHVHYLSDVTFGAALGIASGFAVKLPSPRIALTPTVGPGRAGLFVTIGPRS